jgi:hypothetical protein
VGYELRKHKTTRAGDTGSADIILIKTRFAAYQKSTVRDLPVFLVGVFAYG